jgi:hypothetical protein
MSKISRAPAGAASGSTSIAYTELVDALSGEIARCAARATEQARLLESIGAQSFGLVCEIYRDNDSDTLTRHSHNIRGLVVHGLTILAELQCVAGRLGALAALRAAEQAANVDEETSG